jgi:hypothetical protein
LAPLVFRLRQRGTYPFLFCALAERAKRTTIKKKKYRVSNTFNKLRVANRAEAIIPARGAGLG